MFLHHDLYQLAQFEVFSFSLLQNSNKLCCIAIMEVLWLTLEAVALKQQRTDLRSIISLGRKQ